MYYLQLGTNHYTVFFVRSAVVRVWVPRGSPEMSKTVVILRLIVFLYVNQKCCACVCVCLCFQGEPRNVKRCCDVDVEFYMAIVRSYMR